ncbi:hypothetical protein GGTG_10828 [Gaeumannomyces tritici R3-111a-1]|uniref:Uncharacterized protein n=1 Tax=Gaeumannomyces tritici (strain R3-111a-1) TaxID=644352 RepID=J3PBF5_GAET3|nr:hypothetical protein GGTG_10828 [Gaeumannomyces tritici R3-111a-1]EJT71572.1 hypothetical protein GGTG_10828 [Gaeumannomyces tritici R3-111a-1]
MIFTLYSAVAIVFAASCATATPMALPDTSIESGLSTHATSIGLTADEFLKSNGTYRDATLLPRRHPGACPLAPGCATTWTRATRARPRSAALFSELITNVTVACPPKTKMVVLGLQPGRAALGARRGAGHAPRRCAEQRARATVTLGDTRKEQDGGAIPPLPPRTRPSSSATRRT